MDNDGQHGFACMTGQAQLTAGRVPIAVHYFQGPRYEIGLTLSWRGGGVDAVIDPGAFWLFEE